MTCPRCGHDRHEAWRCSVPSEPDPMNVCECPEGNRPEPNFDFDYKMGQQAELMVGDLRHSLANGRVEVKSDGGAILTGNIYVETACRYPDGWRPTGIANPDTALTWVYDLRGTGVMLVFDVETLRKLAQHPIARRSECVSGDHQTEGVLLPLRRMFAPGVLG